MNHAKETNQTETRTRPSLEYLQKSDSQKAATSKPTLKERIARARKLERLDAGKKVKVHNRGRQPIQCEMKIFPTHT
jgi:SRSO17 transposase